MCSHVYPQNLAQCGAYSRCSINAVAQPCTVLHCSHHLCCREAMLQLLNDKVCCSGREWCPVHRTTAQGGWSQRPWVLSLWGDSLQWCPVVSRAEAAMSARPFTPRPPPGSPGLSLAAPQLLPSSWVRWSQQGSTLFRLRAFAQAPCLSLPPNRLRSHKTLLEGFLEPTLLCPTTPVHSSVSSTGPTIPVLQRSTSAVGHLN